MDYHLPLERSPESAGLARKAVQQKLTEWGKHECVDDAMLVVSELVTNAIRYGTSPLALYLSARAGVVLIGVQDGSASSPPEPRPLTDTHPSGRGMHLIAAVCRRWWWYSNAHSKIVWAELPTAS